MKYSVGTATEILGTLLADILTNGSAFGLICSVSHNIPDSGLAIITAAIIWAGYLHEFLFWAAFPHDVTKKVYL